MACSAHLDFISSGSYNLGITIRGDADEFSIHLGDWADYSENLCQLAETGVSFSGIEGFLFDGSGNFFGGYKKNSQFNIKIDKKNYNEYSYSFNDTLICNDMQFETMKINALLFENKGSSSLIAQTNSPEFGYVKAGDFGDFVQDSFENYLYSSDNILLISKL